MKILISFSEIFHKNIQCLIRIKSNGKKRLFLIFGGLNFLITNLVLHISLLYIPIIFSTIFSQLVNIFIGYYLYGKKVFRLKKLTNIVLKKYIILSLILWFLNYSFIQTFSFLGFNRNLIAFFMIPFLVLISYLSQKKWVFK